MEKCYSRRGDKRSVSIRYVCLLITARNSISCNGFVEVGLSSHFYFYNRLVLNFMIYRYKPLIVLSACFGIVIWAMLLWTESLGALQVKCDNINYQFPFLFARTTSSTKMSTQMVNFIIQNDDVLPHYTCNKLSLYSEEFSH